MSRVQLRNKWWHRTTYSATNKTLFALASAERDSYQSSHSSRNSWDWSPKKVILISGCTHRTPQLVWLSKTQTSTVYHRVRWNPKWLLAEKSSPPAKCFPPKNRCYKTPGPGFSKKTSTSNNNFAPQYPTFRCSARAMEPSALLVIPMSCALPANSWAAILKQRTVQDCQQEMTKATHIWSPTSSLGPTCLSSDTHIS